MQKEESPASGARPRWRVWLRRALMTGVLLPPAAFGLSNLWLASPWGRTTLAGQITRRCGLEAAIGRASWSPWHGLTLHHLAIQQPEALRAQVPEPLLTIERIRIKPHWRALLDRRLQIGEISVERPSLTLTVEMMSHLAQQVTPMAEPPLLAAAQVQPPPMEAAPPATEPSTGPVPEPPQQQPPATPTAPPPPHPAAAGATRWLRCHHASWRLRSASSGKDLLDAREMDLALPFAGAVAAGHVRLDAFTAFGQPALENFQAEIAWEAPVLTLTPSPEVTPVAGVQARFGGQLALLQGLPVTMGVDMPRQKVSLTVPGLDLTVNSPQSGGQARFYGHLLAPGSWHGDLVAGAATPEVRHTGRIFAFDRASGAVVIRGGMLSCMDARLVGEDLSLLGNGTLLADGRLGAALRIVAPPGAALATVAGVFPDLGYEPSPTPLSSPQRVALDIELTGTLAAPLARVGAGAPFRPLTTSHPTPP